MTKRIYPLICCAVLGVASASATVVQADFVIAFDGAVPVFGDGFDAAGFQSPPWSVVSGAPGPQAGGLLDLHGGDMILAPVAVSGQNDTTLVFQGNLADFPADAGLTLMLFGQQPGDFLSITVTPTAAVLSNEAGPLGAILATPGATTQLSLTYSTTGNASGTLDGAPIGFAADSFAPASAVGILVTPEPAGILAALTGLVLIRRGRR